MLQEEEGLPEQESGEQSPLPKLLADKYIRNDFHRKFSNDNNSHYEEDNFKTVLN